MPHPHQLVEIGDVVEYRGRGRGRDGGCRLVRVVDFDSSSFSGEILRDSRNPMNVGRRVKERLDLITRVNPPDFAVHFSDLHYRPFTLRSPYDTED